MFHGKHGMKVIILLHTFSDIVDVWLVIRLNRVIKGYGETGKSHNLV